MGHSLLFLFPVFDCNAYKLISERVFLQRGCVQLITFFRAWSLAFQFLIWWSPLNSLYIDYIFWFWNHIFFDLVFTLWCLRLICWQHLLAKSGVLVWILCLKVADWYQIMVMFCIYHLTWIANWNLYCFLLCNVYCSFKQCVCNQAISFFLNILFLDCELFSFHCFYIEFYCPVFSIYTFMILFSRFTPLQIDMK